MKYIGIDGCRSGWFLITLDEAGNASFAVLERIGELTAFLPGAELVLIDIPIGLRGEQKEPRLCDKQARAVLAPGRKSSIFPSPSRSALLCETYVEANTINKAATGNGLSAQCFGIVPKIREVDVFLRAEAGRQKVREMHPEVAFWALNYGQPMLHSKKTAAGFEERMETLCRHYSNAAILVEKAMQQYLRKQVARDDIVDALAGAVMAWLGDGCLKCFPELPEIDDMGLPMEIVYWGK